MVTKQFSALTLSFLCGHLLKYIAFLESVGTTLIKHNYKTFLKYQCTSDLNFHVRNDLFLSIRCVVVSFTVVKMDKVKPHLGKKVWICIYVNLRKQT